jgi:hypothetical protein
VCAPGEGEWAQGERDRMGLELRRGERERGVCASRMATSALHRSVHTHTPGVPTGGDGGGVGPEGTAALFVHGVHSHIDPTPRLPCSSGGPAARVAQGKTTTSGIHAVKHKVEGTAARAGRHTGTGTATRAVTQAAMRPQAPHTATHAVPSPQARTPSRTPRKHSHGHSHTHSHLHRHTHSHEPPGEHSHGHSQTHSHEPPRKHSHGHSHTHTVIYTDTHTHTHSREPPGEHAATHTHPSRSTTFHRCTTVTPRGMRVLLMRSRAFMNSRCTTSARAPSDSPTCHTHTDLRQQQGNCPTMREGGWGGGDVGSHG